MVACRVELNFFAPHHGHSVCDGHFGCGKRKLRAEIAGGVITDPFQVTNAFRSLKNTTLIELEEIRELILKGLRVYFSFKVFPNSNTVECFGETGGPSTHIYETKPVSSSLEENELVRYTTKISCVANKSSDT